RPIEEPARPLRFSGSVVVAALLTVVIVIFFVYLSGQLLRYSRPPTLAVTTPATAVLQVDESTTSYLLSGTATAGVTVTIRVAGQTEPIRVPALSDGTWSQSVDLRR